MVQKNSSVLSSGRKLPPLKIRNLEIPVPIIQGGMGIGLSSYTLAGAVAREGGMGVLSSAALDRIVTARISRAERLQNPQGSSLKMPRLSARQASAQDVRDAKSIALGLNNENKGFLQKSKMIPPGPIGMNIMVALINQYQDSVLGSMDGGVDAIISGAGLPLALPEIAHQHPKFDEVALIPIASSARAFELICKRWNRIKRLPDAVVVEGPLAGGHIAWRTQEEALSPANRLESLIEEILPVAKFWGDIPIIAAGGIYTHDDIWSALDLGCKGVQMGTRFLATYESGASADYKQALIDCKEDDIELASRPGSPCGLLFRVLKQSPFYQEAIARTRAPKCSKGYLLNKGHCPSKVENEKTFCICNGLLSSIRLNPGEKELYTVGQTAHRIDRIMSVHELMMELQMIKEIHSDE